MICALTTSTAAFVRPPAFVRIYPKKQASARFLHAADLSAMRLRLTRTTPGAVRAKSTARTARIVSMARLNEIKARVAPADPYC